MSRAEIQREKLVNAIIFFTKKTRHCHKLKLFKLLFFLDFKIFRETGRTTTGLTYFAFERGPVPRTLFDELDAPRDDMRAALLITSSKDTDPEIGGNRLDFKARRDFDDGCFTPRELAEMERLAEIFRDALGKTMTDVSHVPGAPWHRVYEVEKRHQALIPYELALDDKPDSITKEQAEQIAEEERELTALFK